MASPPNHAVLQFMFLNEEGSGLCIRLLSVHSLGEEARQRSEESLVDIIITPEGSCHTA